MKYLMKTFIMALVLTTIMCACSDNDPKGPQDNPIASTEWTGEEIPRNSSLLYPVKVKLEGVYDFPRIYGIGDYMIPNTGINFIVSSIDNTPFDISDIRFNGKDMGQISESGKLEVTGEFTLTRISPSEIRITSPALDGNSGRTIEFSLKNILPDMFVDKNSQIYSLPQDYWTKYSIPEGSNKVTIIFDQLDIPYVPADCIHKFGTLVTPL